MLKLVFLLLLSFHSLILAQPSNNWNNSPNNWNNNPNNWNNSPNNWNNNPSNWNNNPNNWNSQNGVYDDKGNRKGYQVQSPEGVTNYFDNNGNRIGYTPK